MKSRLLFLVLSLMGLVLAGPSALAQPRHLNLPDDLELKVTWSREHLAPDFVTLGKSEEVLEGGYFWVAIGAPHRIGLFFIKNCTTAGIFTEITDLASIGFPGLNIQIKGCQLMFSDDEATHDNPDGRIFQLLQP